MNKKELLRNKLIEQIDKRISNLSPQQIEIALMRMNNPGNNFDNQFSFKINYKKYIG
jgi:hypothetical protein